MTSFNSKQINFKFIYLFINLHLIFIYRWYLIAIYFLLLFITIKSQNIKYLFFGEVNLLLDKYFN